MSEKKKLKGIKEKDIECLEYFNSKLFPRYTLVLKDGRKIRVSRKFGKDYIFFGEYNKEEE